MEPVRILQVVGRMDRGGIETLIMNLYRRINRDRVQFDFLTHYGREADYNEEIRALGGRIFEMPAIKTTDGARYHMVYSYVRALNAFFREHQEFKVVHGHMTNTALLYMPIARRHGVKCCIAHSHLTQATRGLTGLVTDLLQLPIEFLADEYFACSKAAARWIFSEQAIVKGRVKIVKNAIDAAQYEYSQVERERCRKSLHIDEDTFVVGHVGRFYHQKNHEFLIDVFNEISNVRPKSLLLLVGDGTLRPLLESKISRLGIKEKVIMLGVRSDVPSLMQAMDVFVMPSHFEGLPLVGVEAQAAGLQCFFSDTITKEIDVTGGAEFLSLSQPSIVWANKILSLAEHTRGSAREAIVAAGYDIRHIIGWLEEFYVRSHCVM